MVSAARGVGTGDLVIQPRLGTGWQTVVDEVRQELRLQFKLLGLPLPVRRKVPFAQVARLGVVCRESWWSRSGTGSTGWAGIILFGMGGPANRPEMPAKGWRYDILLTQRGGGMIRLVTLRPSDDACGLAARLSQRVGLPPGS